MRNILFAGVLAVSALIALHVASSAAGTMDSDFSAMHSEAANPLVTAIDWIRTR